jgi:hypothetical protein
LKAFLVALVVLICSCVNGGGGTASHGAPPATAKGVVLQAEDIPGLQKCKQSDLWAGLMVRGQPEMLPTGMASWSHLQAAGATEGWLSMYADDVSECVFIFGTGSLQGRLVYTAAIEFKDPSSAAADYESDSQAFPVAAGFLARFEAVGGKLTKGSSTGLGENSAIATVSYRGVPTYVAFWQSRNFEAIVWADNGSASEGEAAATRMNGRIH